MSHPKQVDYNRSSQQRKKEAGLVRVETWVPKEDKKDFLAHAKRLRDALDKSKD